ncbi:MAG TPA: glycosyltransferase [Ramlibacter sp.]|uniref:glycosyltransferase n=1 Tax=Ramlibacter sp. TaxID=1917967 RepID=UPI002C36C7F7|nr:glycosyltransferase [Ramlibacter sp.]HVZ42285.1 glycosyltransferase [Ramlibacter sp.]
MRILFVIHQFFPEFAGGTEHVALNLARMAQRGGHHVQVLACAMQPATIAGRASDAPWPGCVRTVYQGLPVVFIPREALPDAAETGLDASVDVAKALAAWMNEERFDLAHVMHTMRMGSAVLALQRAGVPYVATLTDFFLPCARINLVNLAGELCAGPEEGARCARDCPMAPWTPAGYASRYRQAESLLAAAAERCAPSEFVAKRYRAAFPGLAFRVLPHGVDLLKLGSSADPLEERAASGELASDEPGNGHLRLVYIGSVIRAKGLDVLLNALARLPAAPLKLTVIGGHWGDSGYHAEVRAVAETDPRVAFTGRLAAQEVFERLRRCDLLCLPSRVPESFSLVLHESAAAGVPALVSDLGAPAEYVTAHGCGEAVPSEDADAWASAIARVIEAPARLAEWRARLPLPLRVEEEAFFYESLYRRLQPAARPE